MINSKMSAALKPGEYSVYDRLGGFDFGDKSMVGTHTLCITNHGVHVDGYWRDGDGNTSHDLSAEQSGGYLQTNPDGNLFNNFG